MENLQASKLTVMESAAGYYIGRYCISDDYYGHPYSRDSHYFASEEDAKKELEYIREDNPEDVE